METVTSPEDAVQVSLEEQFFKLYPVASNIMEFLSSRDLRSFAKVFPSFEDTANAILRKRRKVIVVEKVCAMHLDTLGDNLQTILQNLWIEPKFVLCLGAPYPCSLFAGSSDFLLGDPGILREIRITVMKETLSEQLNRYVQQLSKCLPTKCKLLPTLILSSCPPSRRGLHDHFHPMLILIPKIDGIELHPYVAGRKRKIYSNGTADVESPLLSRRVSTERRDIKCLLSFEHTSKGIERVEETSWDYLDVDMILLIVDSKRWKSIAFSGENIVVQLVAFGRECCAQQCLSQLQENGFNEESGIAFFLRNNSDFSIKDNWSKAFPKIIPLQIDKIKGTHRRLDVTHKVVRCDGCSDPISIQSEVPTIVVLVLFKNTIFETKKVC